MKKLLFGLGLLLPFLLQAQQVPRSLTASNGVFIGFYEYKPPAYSSQTQAKFPLIIFLHGIGERGDGSSSLSAVLNVGIPRNIHYGLTDMSFNYNGTQQSFLVLSPQLSFNYGNWQNFYIEEMIKYAKQNLRVDTNRIYLTGLSLGGGGTWKYATSSASAAKGLAAIAPICGTCDYTSFCNIAQQALPVWAFHAMDDGVVGVGCTQNAINQINACNPGVAPLATYYPTGNHWIWDQVYDPANPQLYLWFLSKSRSGSAAPPPPGGGNVAPVANAGSGQTITLPTNSVSLSGSSSYDQDGTISSYAWTQQSGPSNATISSPSTANTTVSNMLQGTYVFKLTVTDNAWASSSATVSVTVNAAAAPSNNPPVALTSGNQTINLPTNNAFLTGSGSYDAGGWITNYAWTQVSGPSQAAMTVYSTTNVDCRNLVAGTYIFKLTVTDNQGATGSSNVTVTVNGTSSAPVANAGTDQTLVLPTNTTTLNGSGSQGASSYNWAAASAPGSYNIENANSATPTVRNLQAGTYKFRLTVANSAGATSTADVNVIVSSTSGGGGWNQPPVAVTGSNQTITLPTNNVWLQGSGSYDPGGGSITSYVWTQENGPNQATLTPISTTNYEAKNLVAGTYTFRLTVTDNQGATGTATMTVTVNGGTATPPPSGAGAPVAVAGSNQTVTLPTNSVWLQGSGSYDAGGWITNYSWTQQSGPNQASIISISNSNVQVSNMIAGTYVFKLTVTDNSGLTGSATVSVTVNGNTTTPPPTNGNNPPVADPGSDKFITLPTNYVWLVGSSSYDVGGWVTNYAWTQESGPSQATITYISNSNVEAKNLVAGTYKFRLTVTDNGGATGSATVTVNVYGSTSSANTTTAATEITGSTSGTLSTSTTTTKVASTSNGLVLYPNPVITNLNVQVTNDITGDLQIVVSNSSGLKVKSVQATKTSRDFLGQVNMLDVPSGTYVVEVIFKNGTRLSGQVVKQ